jgi:cell division septum initiation protein DivIVA
MLRQNSSGIDPDQNKHSSPIEASLSGAAGVDIEQKLNQVEEIILASPRIPLIGRTLVDEEQLLDQLDLVRLRLPAAFEHAEKIVRQKEEIVLQAEEYAEEIIDAAEARAAQIMNEMGIIRQAEQEADLIRQQLQQEYAAAQAEIERMRRQAQQELEQMRQRAIADCEEIQQGADAYADSVLKNIEQQLTDMLRVIHNGRNQLQPESPQSRNSP